MRKAILYRMRCYLADGRKIYVSKKGSVHLVKREDAEFWLKLAREPHGAKANNPSVYAKDLSSYGSRSLYLESLQPYVAVSHYEIEPATEPIDNEAFVLGGVLARDVGTFDRCQPS